jgi:hypothetical protein
MTGPEIAMAGKAIEAIGKKALDVDDKTKDHMLQAARDTPEMRAAGQALAARAAVVERIKLRIYLPIARLLGVSNAYFEDNFPEEMAAKTANIPDENFVPPPPSIAVPAMQALSYSFEEPDLKELYLNLLATATDNRRATDAHPAFAEIIKQISADEARVLDWTLRQAKWVQPVVQVIGLYEGGGQRIHYRHLIPLTDDSGALIEEPQVPSWIDNWVRLGLIEVNYLEWLADESKYEWAKARPEYQRIYDHDGLDMGQVDISRGLIRITPFGERFLRAVSPPSGSASATVQPEP